MRWPNGTRSGASDLRHNIPGRNRNRLDFLAVPALQALRTGDRAQHMDGATEPDMGGGTAMTYIRYVLSDWLRRMVKGLLS